MSPLWDLNKSEVDNLLACVAFWRGRGRNFPEKLDHPERTSREQWQHLVRITKEQYFPERPPRAPDPKPAAPPPLPNRPRRRPSRPVLQSLRVWRTIKRQVIGFFSQDPETR